MWKTLKAKAASLARETTSLYYAAKDPRTPWYAKAVAIAVVAYALSPIDLIPDFIPVLGYLDDLLIVPLGVALAVRLIPSGLMEEFRARAMALGQGGNRAWGRAAAIAIGALWLTVITIIVLAVVL